MVKKNPIAISKLICVLIYICFILIYNFKKIKKAKRIFVNSWGFGHSITDTRAYLNHYRNEGRVILLGTSFGKITGTERNNFFNLLQRHELIISLNLPSAFVTKDNWSIVHPLSVVVLRIFSSFLGNRQLIIEGSNEHININILPKIISRKLGIDLVEGKKILTELLLKYKVAENHYQSPHTIQFFFKQPKLYIEILRPKLNFELADFYKKNLEN